MTREYAGGPGVFTSGFLDSVSGRAGQPIATFSGTAPSGKIDWFDARINSESLIWPGGSLMPTIEPRREAFADL
jgi:hypothetical protein